MDLPLDFGHCTTLARWLSPALLLLATALLLLCLWSPAIGWQATCMSEGSNHDDEIELVIRFRGLSVAVSGPADTAQQLVRELVALPPSGSASPAVVALGPPASSFSETCHSIAASFGFVCQTVNFGWILCGGSDQASLDCWLLGKGCFAGPCGYTRLHSCAFSPCPGLRCAASSWVGITSGFLQLPELLAGIG